MTVTEIALLVSSAGGIGGIAALISALKNRKDSKQIIEEVSNSHGTNLRDDVDRIMKGVDDLTETTRQSFRRMDHQFGEMRADVQDVRDDVQDERAERRMDEQTNRDEHKKIWEEIRRLRVD